MRKLGMPGEPYIVMSSGWRGSHDICRFFFFNSLFLSRSFAESLAAFRRASISSLRNQKKRERKVRRWTNILGKFPSKSNSANSSSNTKRISLIIFLLVLFQKPLSFLPLSLLFLPSLSVSHTFDTKTFLSVKLFFLQKYDVTKTFLPFGAISSCWRHSWFFLKKRLDNKYTYFLL